MFDANPDITEVHTHGNTKVNLQNLTPTRSAVPIYDALGSEDERYLIARAVQFFAPGIPQVYYVGLFAGRNDWDFYRETRQPRDINRHYYGMDEIEEEFKRPVVQKMNRLMKLRNSHLLLMESLSCWIQMSIHWDSAGKKMKNMHSW